MKLLMTADTVGGVWTYALELARALQPRQVEVVLATMGRPLSEAQRDEAARTRNVSIHESTFKLEWMSTPWQDVDRAGEWLLRLEKAERPDIVHLNGYAHGNLPWMAPAVVVGHSCVLSWWEAVRGRPAGDEWREYAERVRAGLAAAEVVVVPSDAMRASLVRHYGPLGHTTVIANARDARLFAPAAKEPFIFAAGRVWDEAKNLVALDDVAATLDWQVYVAGADLGPDGRRRPLANACGLGVLDPPTLAWWLGRASIYAFPALYEPFGLSVLEAALSGCALVLGDIPSLREIWGDAATFVPPNDRVALGRALRWLCEDASLRRAHAARARRRALHFDTERMAERYLAVYSVLGVGRRAARGQLESVACAS
ncbi:MAG: glycosyltransferase family 4 protein [Gemmatimonadaceae bacterium]